MEHSAAKASFGLWTGGQPNLRRANLRRAGGGGLGRRIVRRLIWLQQAGFAERDGEDDAGGLLFGRDEVDRVDQAIGLRVVDRRQAEADVLVAVVGFSCSLPGERRAFRGGAQHFVWIVD